MNQDYRTVANDPRLPKLMEMFGISGDAISFKIEAEDADKMFKITVVFHSPVPEETTE